MPKIIENLREKLLTQARKQLFDGGYAALNIRSVAKSCGAAAGTVYNYFPSKDVLVAGVVLEDWLHTIAKISAAADAAPDFYGGLQEVYEGILAFNDTYRAIFAESAVGSVRSVFPARHKMLVEQIEALLRALCARLNHTADDFTVRFVTESILNGCSAQWTFAQLRPVFEKII